MVKPAAAQREPIIFVVTAFTVAAIQVLERQRIMNGLASRLLAWSLQADIFPEFPQTDPKRNHRVAEHNPERPGQRVMRENRIEIARQRRRLRFIQQMTRRQNREDEKEHQPPGGRECDGEPIVAIKATKRLRPRKVGVGFHPNPCHRLGHVDTELMWRGVLTGVQARTAVVTEIGEVIEICLAVELEPARHGRKNGTESFAIATGVANLQHARNFGLV